MKKLLLCCSLLLMMSTLLAACGGTESQEANIAAETDDPLTVYTTVYPLQYFTEQIGGEAVQVESIYPPGTDEHTFEPTQQAMIKLAEADIFFYIGLGLEGFVEKAKGALKNEKVTMVATGDPLLNMEGFGEETKEDSHVHHDEEHDGHHHSDIDPHVWIDPIYAKELARVIKEQLIVQLPEKEQEITNNYQSLAQKLDSLHDQFTEVTGQAKTNKIIVSHAAYGYWESRYNLEQISISGLSSSNEPSQKDLERIIDTANEEKLNYIFFEQNVSSKLTEIVQNELDAQPLMLHNLSTRTEEDIKNNRDYFSIMKDNLTALKTALL
jgi:zinc transport system substrate-binding protein